MKNFVIFLLVLFFGWDVYSRTPSSKTKTVGDIEFVYIPVGSFMMGSPDSDSYAKENEKPQHKVTLSGFWMGKYEITQAQYEAIMGENPSEFKGENNPVEQVSWNDAKDFCEKFSQKYNVQMRLSTEAEWEYACRAGTTTKYYWGDEINGDYCWYRDNSGSQAHPVGQKKPNKWGLYDIAGNVWEWCSDWWDKNYYEESPAKDPQGPDSSSYSSSYLSMISLKVLRGGSWDNSDMRCSYRQSFCSLKGYSCVGFRVVLPK